MDAQMEQKVKATVLDFVARGFMFTAFDITKILRNDGDRVRHSEVNEIVQAMFTNTDMGMYTRDAVNVGATVRPFVYYHPYSDVANYRQDWVEQNPDQTGMKNADGSDDGVLTIDPLAPVGTTMPVPPTSTAPVVSTTMPIPVSATRSPKSANRVFIPSNDGRLHIPPLLVSQIAQIGDAIQVDRIVDCAAPTSDKKRVLIAKTVQGRRDYVVNSDGRIRLSRQITGYLNSTGSYAVSVANGNLVVEAI